MKKYLLLSLALILSAGIVSVDAQAVTMKEKAKAAREKAWQHKGKIAAGAGVAIGTATALGLAAYAAMKKDVEQIFRDNGFAIGKLDKNEQSMAIQWGQAAAAGPSSLQLFFNTAPPPIKNFYKKFLHETGFAAALAELARVRMRDLPGVSQKAQGN